MPKEQCVKCGSPASNEDVSGYEDSRLCTRCVDAVMRKRVAKRRALATRTAARARQRRM